MSGPLFLSRKGPVTELVLNRPERRNALTERMLTDIPGLLNEALEDAGLRVLVVRGAGGHFTAGADIGEFADIYATESRADAYSLTIARALDALAAFPAPVIARVEGACIGGGCGLALACDLRFATETARLGITPAKLGLAFPFNDTKRLVDAVGIPAAKDLIFTARHVGADEALAMGLVDRVWPLEHFDAEFADWLAPLLAGSPHTAKVMKQMIGLIAGGAAQETSETRKLFRDAFTGDDFQEGYQAFLGKRAPDFTKRRS
ncbi:MAG: enoyl-CoA hydratase [Maricaulis sp.]|jgi:enoyl-CoA hydratase/carnithine racemase|nr:enoyl-CoA hydratase [Maricaulis sp.]